MARPKTARAESARETRDALVAAATAAFAEEGLDAPSLDAICERAGYTRGAFYVHFRDRDELIGAVMDSLTSGFVETLLPATGGPVDLADLVTRFAMAVARGAYPIRSTVRLHHVLDACARSPTVRSRRAALLRGVMDRIAAAAREGQRNGVVRADVDPGAVAVLLLSIVMGIEVLTEVGVPFGATAAAGALLDLVRPPAPAAAPAGGRPARRPRVAPRRAR